LGTGEFHRGVALLVETRTPLDRKRPPDRAVVPCNVIDRPCRSSRILALRRGPDPRRIPLTGRACQGSLSHVPAILHIAARGTGASDLARISDADGGDRRQPR